ncbi:hypothetical protein Gasu2_13620 [Galdieria sulphuraria]|nr:hypothetical protein Gasu2_13620 [Galdieria sulphuraria]
MTSSSSTGRTVDSSFSANVERGREILKFLTHSSVKNYDINSDSDDYGTSSSSDIDKLCSLSPKISLHQNKNREGLMSTNEACPPRFGVLNEKRPDYERPQVLIESSGNELMMENHRIQMEIYSERERNAALSKRLEHVMDKLSQYKSEKKAYLHRMEVLKQEVIYLKNELHEYHSQSKSAREREYELQSQLKGLQIKHEQLFKDYMDSKELVATLKQKLDTKELVISQMKEREEKYFELEETWKLERDSLVREYEDCLLNYKQLERKHEKFQYRFENDEEQFATVERVLHEQIEELERKEEAKEVEIENLRKEKDLSWHELQQVKRELALKTENIRNYETQLICTEEALRFSKESATRLEQQLHDWLEKREQLENRLEEREKQNNLLYSENADLRRTLKECQDKISEQQTEVEIYKDKIRVFESLRNLIEEKAPSSVFELNNNRIDSAQQTDVSGPIYESELENLFSRMCKSFIDFIHELQLPNEKYFQNTNGRGHFVGGRESLSISDPIVKSPNKNSPHFPIESKQISAHPRFSHDKDKTKERDFDKFQDDNCSVFCIPESIGRNTESEISQIHEWKLKLMEWKFLLDVNMKQFLSVMQDKNVAATVNRLSEELFLLVSNLEKLQSSYQVSSKVSMEQNIGSSKSALKPDQESIVLGAILTHILQLRNLWLHEVEMNHVLRSMLLSTNVADSHFSGKLCEFPQLTNEYSSLLDSDYLDRDIIE